MPKKKGSKKQERQRREKEAQLQSFAVYQQQDAALVVIPASDEPEDEDAEYLGTVEAESELEAIRQFRKENKWAKKAAVANPDHDPDVNDSVRKDREREVNERLGITPRPSAKKGARKKRAAKSGAKKKTAKKGGRKKTARRK